MDTIATRLDRLREQIAGACLRAGRTADSVRLLAVSKTYGPDVIRQAYAAGEQTFGENNVQEATAKAEALQDLADIRWAMVGHLQTNKIKYVARFAHEFHALDSMRVASELDRRLQALGRSMDIFIQVNSSGESSKFGLEPEKVIGFVRELRGCDSLRLKGLMTLAVRSPDQERVAACFQLMAHLREQVRDLARSHDELSELSMGMSGDFEVAIEHGATVVRLGRAIFGERPPYRTVSGEHTAGQTIA